jgi:hypothetical protein
MRTIVKVFPAIVWVMLGVCGCVQRRCVPSLIHPHTPGRPFQECSVDLSFYKPVQERAGQDANIVLAVAASGGGYRAANFAAGALAGLEEIKNLQNPASNALSEVDYFSSVSGGGFAVGAYITTLRDYRRFSGSTDGFSFGGAMAVTDEKCPCARRPSAEEKIDPCVRKHLAGLYRDFITDFLGTLLPWNYLGFNKRNLRFEQAIDDDTLGYRWRRKKLESLGDPKATENAVIELGDIFVRAEDVNRQVELPYWFANGAVYQNAMIFPFSPDQLSLYRLSAYYHRRREQKRCGPHRDCEDFNEFIFSVPVSVGVTSSANFPLAMPPLRFASEMDPNNPYFYLLDGGVSDNLGVVTALRVLGGKTEENAIHKAIVVIDSFQGDLTPFEKAKDPPEEAAAAVRLMEIGLDSWRARYREAVNQLCEEKGVKAIYISFDDLVGADFNDLLPFGLSEKDKKELCEHKPRNCPSATPFYIVRSITMQAPVFWGKHGLEYRIPEAQQNLLIAAGRYVVDKKRDEILNAMGWE